MTKSTDKKKWPKKLIVDSTYKVSDAQMWKLKRDDGTFLLNIYVDIKKNVKPTLIEIAKHIGIENISRMKKQELVDAIQKYLKFDLKPKKSEKTKQIIIEYETDDNDSEIEIDFESDDDNDSMIRYERLMKRMKKRV